MEVNTRINIRINSPSRERDWELGGAEQSARFFFKSLLVLFLYFHSDYIFEMPEGPKAGNPTCQQGSILGRISPHSCRGATPVPAQVQEKTHISRLQVLLWLQSLMAHRSQDLKTPPEAELLVTDISSSESICYLLIRGHFYHIRIMDGSLYQVFRETEQKNNQSLNSYEEEGKILLTLCLPYILYGSKQNFLKRWMSSSQRREKNKRKRVFDKLG